MKSRTVVVMHGWIAQQLTGRKGAHIAEGIAAREDEVTNISTGHGTRYTGPAILVIAANGKRRHVPKDWVQYQ